MAEDIRKYDPHEHEPLPEGEEAAPPLTHTMAIVRWVILGAMTLFALIMVLGYFGLTPWSGDAAGAQQFHCPMHPTYISNQPGDCPICGMSLVAIDSEGHEVAASGDTMGESGHEAQSASMAKPGQYTCPMDPEVVSDTAGRCPKCGMFLEQVPMAAQPGQYTCPMDPEVISDTLGRCPKCGMFLEQVPEAKATYACPMHPEVTSDRPGDCPKCGMPLESVKAETGVDHSAHGVGGADNLGSAPVPGLVPVTIEPQRLQLIGVRTGRVERRPLNGSLRLVGFVTPDETRLSDIHVRFSGWVKELEVAQTGQPVTANQKLLSVYSQDLYQAEQDYIVAREAMARVADPMLKETRKQLLDVARQRLQLLGIPAEEFARLETANSPSAELWVKSPFSGYVLEKNVVAGQFIGPDQKLFAVADLSRVWVLVDVYERDLASIRVGQKARMTTSAYPGEEFEGLVSFIYPAVSEETRTLKIRMEFSNQSFRLKPGMYAEVALEGKGDRVLAVPSDAVMDGGDQTYAFVVHNGTHFEPRLIQSGRRSDDYMEVLAGLSEGEQVVTSANFLIDSESRLKAAIAGMGATQTDAHAGHGK
ncbi:MAG: efflux RND transporter periplasmic adaptor subunit [Candidatus Zixiibacteriota bacterium]